jgi:hypothetical protein
VKFTEVTVLRLAREDRSRRATWPNERVTSQAIAAIVRELQAQPGESRWHSTDGRRTLISITKGRAAL